MSKVFIMVGLMLEMFVSGLVMLLAPMTASAIAGGLFIIGLTMLLQVVRKEKLQKLIEGFEELAGSDMGEMDWLKVVALEEIGRYRRMGLYPTQNRHHLIRTLLTVTYILLVFWVLSVGYYKAWVFRLLTAITTAYLIAFYCFDPLRVICKAIRKEPDRSFHEIIGGMMSENVPKSLLPVGIAAFLAAIALFVGINSKEQFICDPISGGLCLTQYRPAAFDFHSRVQIPESQNGQPVVAIGPSAFQDFGWITEVQIPETVTVIDSYAFKNCEKLTEIQLPGGLTTLNGESFKGCAGLREITIPTGVTEIRGNTFEDCTELETVVLHDGIVDIHAYAFRNCRSLKNIDLPANITRISAYTFENCVSLETVNIPIGVTSIRAHAFYNCESLRYVYVPDTVTEIRSSAFRLCGSLKTIDLPAGISVDEKAFKESPTEIRTKDFTDEQIQKINEELFAKEITALYYIADPSRDEGYQTWEEDGVILVDDARYAEKLTEQAQLQELTDNGQVIAFLEKAKAEGMTKVRFIQYTQVGSDIKKTHRFVSYTKKLDDMIEMFMPQE